MTGPGGGERIRVERLDPALAAEAGAVVSASHADYPGFQYMFPDPAVRRRALPPFLTASARDAARHGHALVARDEAGMLGVALWMPPGTFPPSTTRQLRMAGALARVALAARGSVRRFVGVGASLMQAHLAQPAWYLQAMGVHPRAQRRGVGTMLMAPALTLADEAGLPCYLQTSDAANVAYYQRFGFEVVQPSIATVPGGHPYLGMLRPAGGPAE